MDESPQLYRPIGKFLTGICRKRNKLLKGATQGTYNSSTEAWRINPSTLLLYWHKLMNIFIKPFQHPAVEINLVFNFPETMRLAGIQYQFCGHLVITEAAV